MRVPHQVNRDLSPRRVPSGTNLARFSAHCQWLCRWLDASRRLRGSSTSPAFISQFIDPKLEGNIITAETDPLQWAFSGKKPEVAVLR